MNSTKIEWTDTTWNPVRGCSRVSEGCRNCYAEKMAARFSDPGMPYEGLAARNPARWTGEVRLIEEHLEDPKHWRKPRRVFVNSMSDLFHERLPFADIDRVFDTMLLANHHIYQILTKRPARMLEYFQKHRPMMFKHFDSFGKHIWLGVSTEDQKTANERIPLLLETPAAVRFISAEPLLGSIDLLKSSLWTRDELAMANAVGMGWANKLHWVICGGESGPTARPMHPDWARSLRDQCLEAGVPFFFKQHGAWAPIDEPWKQDSPKRLAANERWMNFDGGHGFHGTAVWRMRRVGKKLAGRLLDGRTWDEMPTPQPVTGGALSKESR